MVESKTLDATDVGLAGSRRGATAAKHVPALDGIRGLAILLVLVYHFFTIRPASQIEFAAARVAAGGWIGVDLFFVLSGFLITGILYDAKGQRGYFFNFYMRRFLRIFPLYYGLLALYVFVLPRIPSVPANLYQTLVDRQAWYWTYLSNVSIAIDGYDAQQRGWTHFWSLAVEEQFYLVWPAVVFLCTRRRLMTVCASCVAAAFALRIGLWLAGMPPRVAVVLVFARMDSLAAGALLALMIRGSGIDWMVRPAQATLAVTCAIVGWVFLSRRNIDAQNPIVHMVCFSALALGCAAAIAICIARPRGWLSRVLSQPALRFWAPYSYGLYVVHRVVGYQLADWGLASALPSFGSRLSQPFLVMIVDIAASLAVAMASWHLYEKQFLKLKDRFPYAPPMSTATVAEAAAR